MTDTDTDTQDKRDIELEYYREQLSYLAYFGDEAILDMAQWAENVLAKGESITGPGVDMTDEERAAAVKLLEE